jgi:hypothetical protein
MNDGSPLKAWVRIHRHAWNQGFAELTGDE